VMKPSLPAKTALVWRRRCSSRMTSTSLAQYDGGICGKEWCQIWTQSRRKRWRL